MEKRKSKIIHISIIITIIIVIITVAFIIMLKYQVEGEKNLPFQLSKLMIVSNVEGKQIESSETLWNAWLNQNNDVYINIEKNPEYKKNETIKNVTLENFNYTSKPKVGEVKLYRPSDSGLFEQDEKFIITDKIQYNGAKEGNINKLEIGNQGGILLFRAENEKITDYKSNEQEVTYTGRILKDSIIKQEDLQYTMSFDIIIETGSKVKYKANITLDFPVGDLYNSDNTSIEKTDFNDIIFKRI